MNSATGVGTARLIEIRDVLMRMVEAEQDDEVRMDALAEMALSELIRMEMAEYEAAQVTAQTPVIARARLVAAVTA